MVIVCLYLYCVDEAAEGDATAEISLQMEEKGVCCVVLRVLFWELAFDANSVYSNSSSCFSAVSFRSEAENCFSLYSSKSDSS